MKKTIMLLTLLASASIAAMEHEPSKSLTPVIIFRTFTLNPNEQLSIEQSLLIQLKRKAEPAQTPPSKSSQVASALSEFVFGPAPEAKKLRLIEIKALIETTKQIELPYTLVKDGNIMRIHLSTRANELGITLKELIITVPANMNVAWLKVPKA